MRINILSSPVVGCNQVNFHEQNEPNGKNKIIKLQQRRNMSHLISGLSVSPEPILDKSPLKQIVSPKFKHLLLLKDGSSCNDMQRYRETWKQQAQISKLCKKLTERQFCLLRQHNATEIQHQFSRLKSKIRRHIQPNAPSVGKFFENHKQITTLNVKQLLQKMPEKISLISKYNTKLTTFVQTLNELRQISSDKENYKRWFDYQNNSPTKSPNYCRMSFVLEKLATPQKENCNETVQNWARNLKPKDSYDKRILAPRKEQNYRPKPKRIKTLGHEASFILK